MSPAERRDLFAAAALQGYMAAGWFQKFPNDFDRDPSICWKLADAVLAAEFPSTLEPQPPVQP